MTVTDTSSLSAALAAEYTLERELGRGGMATVYLAQDRRHARPVALKVLHSELGASLGPERFQREIQLAARLTHPHILPVLDSGAAAGRLWYAMPYVEGETLRARLQREAQLGVAEAVGIATQVAGALGYAHAQGIVHRDIKPENILLAGDQALVADFGIAKLLDAGGERLTATGLSLGTPAYMSPEQGSGGRVDARSDVYALGCVVYEMLAGAPPFTGPTAQAILARHAVDPVPPLRTVRRQLPPAVERAVERALAKVPADRFATAGEFAAALEIGPVSAAPARWSAARIALATVVLLTAAAMGLWALKLSRPSDPPVHPSASAIAVLPLGTSAADTALTRLGRDLAVTISASLDGVGGIETSDRLAVANATTDRTSLSAAEAAALARRLGASSMLRGTMVRAGDNVRIDLGLYGTEGLAPLAEGISVSAHRDSIGTLTDSVAWALLRQIWQRGEPPSPSLAAVTTRSLPALRAFLDGEHALAANRWQDGALAFRGAIAADSTFWLAYFRYALARWWKDQPVEEPELLKALHLHQQVLPERERLLVRAFLTRGDSMDLRIERHRQVTERFPDYWPGWFLYGDALYHFGSERGYDWTEAVEALRRAVALNPKLTPAWLHLSLATLGKDSVEAERVTARLAELGWPPPGDLFEPLLLGVARAGGVIPSNLMGLADSVIGRAGGGEKGARSGSLGLMLLQNGFAVAQLQINQRGMSSSLSPLGKAALEAANAWAWAARGRWDSALTIMTRAARHHHGVTGPRRHWTYIEPHPVGSPLGLQSYELAVTGAWLGALPAGLADERRPLAVSAVAELPDEYTRQQSLGRLAWLDGILGFVRQDRRAVRMAREDATRSGYYQAAMVDRSLAAFDQALAGERTRAGRELAALDMECLNRINCSLLTPHIGVHRLAAAQWLAEGGDTEQARRLLRWHDAEATAWPPALWTLIFALGGPNYLARARLEEAAGDTTRAREYYRQFLRRYDQPMPSQLHLVEEARVALARLSSEP